MNKTNQSTCSLKPVGLNAYWSTVLSTGIEGRNQCLTISFSAILERTGVTDIDYFHKFCFGMTWEIGIGREHDIDSWRGKHVTVQRLVKSAEGRVIWLMMCFCVRYGTYKIRTVCWRCGPRAIVFKATSRLVTTQPCPGRWPLPPKTWTPCRRRSSTYNAYDISDVWHRVMDDNVRLLQLQWERYNRTNICLAGQHWYNRTQSNYIQPNITQGCIL